MIAPRPIPLPSSFLTLQDILQLPLHSFTVGIGDPHVPQADFGRARVAPLVHVFTHDVWRLRSRLTLNYGVGWNFDGSLKLRPAQASLPAALARGQWLGPNPPELDQLLAIDWRCLESHGHRQDGDPRWRRYLL